MTIWRLCKTRWVKTAFTGAGAAQIQVGWTLLGTESSTVPNAGPAAWEILAHVEDRADLAKAAFSAIPVEVAEDLIEEFPIAAGLAAESPGRSRPASSVNRLVETGDASVLKVPSRRRSR